MESLHVRPGVSLYPTPPPRACWPAVATIPILQARRWRLRDVIPGPKRFHFLEIIFDSWRSPFSFGGSDSQLGSPAQISQPRVPSSSAYSSVCKRQGLECHSTQRLLLLILSSRVSPFRPRCPRDRPSLSGWMDVLFSYHYCCCYL